MRNILLIALLAVIFNGCKDDNPVNPLKADNPSVTLKTPANNINVADSVAIEAEAADDKGVVKVEIYIDNAADELRTFYAPPYKYIWNTDKTADGTSHTIYAKAYDADGNETASNVVTVTVFRLRPGNLKASIVSDSLVLVTWHDNSSIETGFDIEQKSKNGQFTVVKSVNANDTSALVTGMFLSDSVYYFRVAAKMQSQKSSYSNIDSIKFAIEAPSNFTVSVVSDTLIKYNWEDNSGNETGFSLEESNDGVSYFQVKVFPANSVSGFLTGIFSASKNYAFRLRSVSKYNYSSFTPVVPAKIIINPPSDLQIISVNNNSVKLLWKDNCLFDKGIQIERKTNTNEYQVIGSVISGKNYFTDTTLDKTNSYTYRLKAYTLYNSSDYFDLLKIKPISKGYQTFGIINVGENINTIAFNPEGSLIACGCTDNYVRIYKTGQSVLDKKLTGFTAPVNSVAFSPDGLFVAAGGQDNTIKIWRLADGALTTSLNGHTGSVSSIAFSRDGNMLISCSFDKSVKVWRFSDGALLKTLNGHQSAVTAAVISQDGDYIASGSTQSENKIKIWQMKDMTFLKDISDSASPVNTVSISPNNQFIAAGYANNNIKLWNALGGNNIFNMQGHTSAVSSIGFNSDGSQIISSSYDKTIKIWRTSDGSLLYTLTGHNDIVKQAIFTSDSQTIASCGYDKGIRFWQISFEWTKIP